MRIDGSNNGVRSLKLVQPPASAKPVERTTEVDRTSGSDQGRDTIHFDSIYVRKLPVQQLTEAHRKLERIRNELVAGKTAVPIHFQSTPVRQNSNPYLSTHLRFGVDSAGLNESATQHAADAEDRD